MECLKYIKEIFFVENGGQRNSQEENEKKNKDFTKNFLHRGHVHQSLDI
jgi:hypothetical protein